MKEIGAQPLMKNGLNFKKALTLLDFLVDDRGQVAVPNALLMSPFLLMSPGELASNGPPGTTCSRDRKLSVSPHWCV
jgi:hypothetical protein